MIYLVDRLTLEKVNENTRIMEINKREINERDMNK